jgi:hypothetical protein
MGNRWAKLHHDGERGAASSFLLLEHNRPATVNAWFCHRSKSQFLGYGYGSLERLAGNMNLWFGCQQLSARLEAIVNLTKQPLLIWHLMDHHHCQSKVNGLFDAQAIPFAFVKLDVASHACLLCPLP